MAQQLIIGQILPQSVDRQVGELIRSQCHALGNQINHHEIVAQSMHFVNSMSIGLSLFLVISFVS